MRRRDLRGRGRRARPGRSRSAARTSEGQADPEHNGEPSDHRQRRGPSVPCRPPRRRSATGLITDFLDSHRSPHIVLDPPTIVIDDRLSNSQGDTKMSTSNRGAISGYSNSEWIQRWSRASTPSIGPMDRVDSKGFRVRARYGQCEAVMHRPGWVVKVFPRRAVWGHP
jgi:hypothetical protein